ETLARLRLCFLAHASNSMERPAVGRLLGIHVDADRDLAEKASTGQGLDRLADSGDGRLAVLRLEQETTPVAVADAEHRRRSEQVGVAGKCGAQLLRQRGRGTFEALLGLGAQDYPSQVREGRIAQGPPPLDLLGKERGGVVGGGMDDAGG